MTEKKLNLGCGTDIREGYINLDKKSIDGVDIVHDIEGTLANLSNFTRKIYEETIFRIFPARNIKIVLVK